MKDGMTLVCHFQPNPTLPPLVGAGSQKGHTLHSLGGGVEQETLEGIFPSISLPPINGSPQTQRVSLLSSTFIHFLFSDNIAGYQDAIISK